MTRPPRWWLVGLVGTGFAMAALVGVLPADRLPSAAAPLADACSAGPGAAAVPAPGGLLPGGSPLPVTLAGEGDGTRSGGVTPPSRAPRLRLVARAAGVSPAGTRASFTRRTLSVAVHPDLLHAPPERRHTPLHAA